MIAFEGQFNRLRTGNYFNSFTFATYGLAHETELAATLFGVSSPHSNNRALGLGFKKLKSWQHSAWTRKWELKNTFGAVVPIGLDNNGTGYWLFGNVSVRVPAAKTRLTAGPSFGTRQIFGRRTYSTMLGVEQPLTKRWSIVSDWYSGTHDLAAAVFAFQYQPQPHTIIIVGWKVANNAQSGVPAFLVEVTRTFGHSRSGS